MSYFLEYNPELRNQYPPVRRKKTNIPVKYLLYALGAAVIGYVLIGIGWVQYLIPGDPQVTSEALEQLLQQIGTGESVGVAVQTFFTSVITGGA